MADPVVWISSFPLRSIPKPIGLSRQASAGVYFGKGLKRYSNVYVDDLADLYLLVMEKAPGGSFFFAENGNNSFKEIAEMISNCLGLGGKAIGLPMAHVILHYGETARLGVGSNSCKYSAARLGAKRAISGGVAQHRFEGLSQRRDAPNHGLAYGQVAVLLRVHGIADQPQESRVG
jgi:hypothetical protein